MSESPLENVADTAFWIATYRAQEGDRKDALFADPLARRLVEGRGEEIAAKMGNQEAVGWAVAVRTYLIDNMIRVAIEQGIDTILNLGAGLDTRPYRLPLPKTLRWIEVDFAPTIQFKEGKLSDATPHCQLRRISLDLSDAAARSKLLTEVNAESQKTLVLTEGVIPYLKNDDVAALARDLHRQPHFAYWIVDYFSPTFMKMTRRASHRRRMGNAPFVFDPPDWTEFFSAAGWTVKQMQYMAIEGAKIGRPPPSLWWVRTLFKLAPKSWTEKVMKLSAYALMERKA